MPAAAALAAPAACSSGRLAWRQGLRPAALPALLRPLAPARHPRGPCSRNGQRVAAALWDQQPAAAAERAEAPAPLAAADPPAAEAAQLVAAEVVQDAAAEQHERWMPASWLSGWKGMGSMLLSLGAVTGGGLLGSGFDLKGPESVLQAVGVLGLTVGIHELGHFLAAVTRGIHVTKFSIGFGPTLLKWQGKEVEYSLRLLPLGGFVAFPDDDPESPYPADDPNLLRNRPIGDRTAVITAGVLANMVLAFAICVTQASTVGIPEPIYRPGVRLGEIKAATVAAQAGLQQGDVLLRVGDLEVAPSPASVQDVVAKIRDNPGRELQLTVQRAGEQLVFPITPAPSPKDGTGRIGIQLASNAEILRKTGSNPVDTVVLATQEYAKLTGTVLKGLYQFITNFSETVENVSGPVAILAVGAEVARSNAAGLYQFAALVNINLAIVNILPLPALDGGELVLVGVEAAQGRCLDRDVRDLIAAFGNGFIVLLAIWMVTNDLEALGSFMFYQAAQLTGAGPAPEDMLPLATALLPLLPLPQ